MDNRKQDKTGKIIFYVLLLLLFSLLVFIIGFIFIPVPNSQNIEGTLATSESYVKPEIGQQYIISDIISGLYLSPIEKNRYTDDIPIRLNDQPTIWLLEEATETRDNVINCKFSLGNSGEMYTEFDDDTYLDTYITSEQNMQQNIELNYTLSGNAFDGYLISLFSRTLQNGNQTSVILFEQETSLLVDRTEIKNNQGRLRFSQVPL